MLCSPCQQVWRPVLLLCCRVPLVLDDISLLQIWSTPDLGWIGSWNLNRISFLPWHSSWLGPSLGSERSWIKYHPPDKNQCTVMFLSPYPFTSCYGLSFQGLPLPVTSTALSWSNTASVSQLDCASFSRKLLPAFFLSNPLPAVLRAIFHICCCLAKILMPSIQVRKKSKFRINPCMLWCSATSPTPILDPISHQIPVANQFLGKRRS